MKIFNRHLLRRVEFNEGFQRGFNSGLQDSIKRLEFDVMLLWGAIVVLSLSLYLLLRRFE